MCFVFDNSTKRMIAAEDILCYKTGYPAYFLRSIKIGFCSQYQSYTYYKRKQNRKVGLTELSYAALIKPIINEGYHSYKNVAFIIQNLDRLHLIDVYASRYCIAEFIIPKGSVYYENGTEYVSSNIMLNKILKPRYVQKLVSEEIRRIIDNL